ncbi:MAG: nitrate- and nitrite sensing domain-containing protein [Ramlibacter sp.]
MKSASSFLLAARACEIAELEQLARTSELVALVCQFTHALQRERGISNVFLGTRGQSFGGQRLQQAARCDELAQQVRARFDLLDTDAGGVRNGARLFSRVASLLHALDGLPALRARVAAQAVTPRESTEGFSRCVAGLLAVVFEAADNATDPQVSRALVALFNFMQGKEFAGQERAFGAAVFASGRIDAAGQQHWRHLIELQQGCFQVFGDFAGDAARHASACTQEPEVLAQLERLRRIGGTLDGAQAQDHALSQAWYDGCTARIDAMKSVEDLLAQELRRLCEQRIAQAREELRDQQQLLQALTAPAGAAPGPAHYGPHLERAILDLVQEQGRRLQAMSDELDTVRASLNDRKLVERAKGLLMAHRHMSEDDAYKALRRMAMNQGRRLVEVAAAVLATAEVLPGRVR